MKYSLSPAFSQTAVNLSATPARPPRPLLGPEIGPDPRNANCTIRLPSTPTQEENGVLFDFNFGYRVKCPEPCRIRVYDDDTELLMAEHVVNDDRLILGER